MIESSISPARVVAFTALNSIFLKNDTDADSVLDELIRAENLSERDSALAFELVYGVLRNLKLLDYYLEPFLSRSLQHTPPQILNILRLAAYQKLKLTRVPDYALVNESVKLAKEKFGIGAGKFVNAVLRRFISEGKSRGLPAKTKDPLKFLTINYSYPAWLVRYLIKQFGESEAEQFMSQCNEPAPLDLRTNILKIDPPELLQRLHQSGYTTAHRTQYAPACIRLPGTKISALRRSGILEQGLATVQDEAAQLIIYLLSPAPGMRIVDYCSAPGGKATHLAELCRDNACIIAFDINPERLKLVEENCQRLGLKSVITLKLTPENYEKIKAEKTDAVLVDAPCSGLGTLRRHPEIRWKKRQSDIKRLANLQLKICEEALPLVRPEGIFVYSVCTITPEETREVIKVLLERHPELQPTSVINYLPGMPAELVTEDGYLATYPHRHSMDAFFAVRFVVKKS